MKSTRKSYLRIGICLSPKLWLPLALLRAASTGAYAQHTLPLLGHIGGQPTCIDMAGNLAFMGEHVLQMPVSMAADNRVVSARPGSSHLEPVQVELPSGALTSDTTLTVRFPDPAALTPQFSSQELVAGPYVEFSLESGQTDLASDKMPVITV
jgi:hypothetical protein